MLERDWWASQRPTHTRGGSTLSARPDRPAQPLPTTGRLIIVSNRLPITVTLDAGVPVVRPSVGGLATGLRAPHEQSGGVWIGWPGDTGDLAALSDEAAAALARQFASLRVAPVSLTPDEISIFYERIANGVLWAICHDRLDMLPMQVSGWDVYERVNARFADVVAEQYRDGDLIWVHDYQLLRLPALIRQRLPNARIGFFLHIPFPNPEIFFALPTRRWLVEGMLGADVIGFHTRRYRGHFTAALRRLFGVEMDSASQSVSYAGRRVRLGIFPMGVDAAGIAERASSHEVTARAAELRAEGQRLLVGIDRLDYSKGIPRRLLAFERLLVSHPEWIGHVRLVQVAVPSRIRVQAYRRFRRTLDGLVGRINGRFGTESWTPVHYLYRGVSDELLLALYRAADVMLVTPLRDGMNLVAKEFPASRVDGDGVLVLSEFAGAADELTDALLVNPYDVADAADATHRALSMPEEERRRRMRGLRHVVTTHHVQWWVASFLDVLGKS